MDESYPQQDNHNLSSLG